MDLHHRNFDSTSCNWWNHSHNEKEKTEKGNRVKRIGQREELPAAFLLA